MDATGQPERTKEIVTSFITLAVKEGDPSEAARRHIGPYYRQHNPRLPDGPGACVRLLTGLLLQG